MFEYLLFLHSGSILPFEDPLTTWSVLVPIALVVVAFVAVLLGLRRR
jgi:hypothetical protein